MASSLPNLCERCKTGDRGIFKKKTTFFRGIRKIKHDLRHYNGHRSDFDKQLLDLINRLKMRFSSAKSSIDGDIFNLITT